MKTLPAWWMAIAVVGLCACGSTGDDTGNGADGGGLNDATTNPFGDGATTDGATDGAGDGSGCYAPVDMYIMLDRSCSMGKDCDIGSAISSKWCHAVNALSGYFNSPSAAGNAVALQFFPLVNHTAASCTTGAGYDVAAAPTPPPAYTTLPTNAFDALLNATTDNTPCITPTEAAIRGLTKFTAANRRGGRVTIGMLVTDGAPYKCDTNLTDLSNLLQAQYTATSLRTYVIGMTGANDANLEQLAQGGNAPLHPDVVGKLTGACGTSPSPCRHWNVGDGNPDAFIAALAAIQQSADGCTDGGGTINPN